MAPGGRRKLGKGVGEARTPKSGERGCRGRDWVLRRGALGKEGESSEKGDLERGWGL